MTGAGGEGAHSGSRATRRQPPVEAPQVTREDYYDEEEDQIEIPAFLRRQAN